MEECASTAAASGASSQDDPAPRLPTEICGRIIDHVAAGLNLHYTSLAGNPALLALQSCALVCRDWYFHTWYHLRQRVHLRDRNDVRSLSRTLHERPRLRGVVQQVVISGHTPRQRSPIQHLGTFSAMLAGKLPELSRISIEDAEWPVGLMRVEDFGYLAAFHLVHTLDIANVTVSSIAQLARLISALPALRELYCVNVDCSQKHPVSPVSLPLNCASLEFLDVRWVAPAVEDLLVRISQASRLRKLYFGVDGDYTSSSAGSRTQALLDASAASVEVLTLWIAPASSVDSHTVGSTVERHFNLSRHEMLWRLHICLYHPFVAWSWIPHMVSRIHSDHLMAISVLFFIHADHASANLDGAVTMMEEDGTLVRLDDILQADCFADIASGGICLGFDHDGIDWLPVVKLFDSESSFREQCGRRDELVRRKMPRCNGRRILTYVLHWVRCNGRDALSSLLSIVHSFEEHENWCYNMNEIHEATQHQKAKTGVEVQSEDDAAHAPDTSG
ncbi:uncharacterized protein C8Q71DRAFT_436163 [Rhodofomes roseus]|uniref:F-box domain-containing protein n=1 Tax=Rhodofomes roseus TaxID=34475 RepID=A0ABQ8KR38_9APHY|nr:uncharacterized protein C8Q71DRAFT_436163 [Rhodofomes roseus]KAH9841051.1 hypothetical protein C8Q71DRAFT_436163 [Rhodofomes roseus]